MTGINAVTPKDDKMTIIRLVQVSLLALNLFQFGLAAAQINISEDFSTTTHMNHNATTADWNTDLELLQLFPFEVTLEGRVDLGNYARGISVDGDYAYVADGYAGVQILDISDASNPVVVANEDTPGYAYQVHVSGNYLYVADHSGGLRVLDISDPTSVSTVGSAGTSEVAIGLFVEGNYVYMSIGGDGVAIFDITSPSDPFYVGGYVTTNGVVSLEVDGNYAFVTAGEAGLVVLDVTDPTFPVLAGAYDSPGYAYDVSVEGNLAFLSDRGIGMIAIDISDPTNPYELGTYLVSSELGGLQWVGDRVYLSAGTIGMIVLDVSNPSLPVLDFTFDTDGTCANVEVEGNKAYLCDFGAGFKVVTLMDPTSPYEAGNTALGGFGMDVQVVGDHALTAQGYGGLGVIDISDPTQPSRVASRFTAGIASKISVSGNHAYLATQTGGLVAFDITDLTSPTIIDTYGASLGIYDVEVVGDFAYVIKSTSTFEAVHVSNPSSLSSGDSYSLPGMLELQIAGDLAWVLTSSSLAAINITNPHDLALVNNHSFSGTNQCLEISGDVAYVGTDDGLKIFSIANPSSPVELTVFHSGNSINALDIAGDQLVIVENDNDLMQVDISNPAIPIDVGRYNASDQQTYTAVDISGRIACFTGDNDWRMKILGLYGDEVDAQNNEAVSLGYSWHGRKVVRAKVSHFYGNSNRSLFLKTDEMSDWVDYSGEYSWRVLETPGSSFYWKVSLNFPYNNSPYVDYLEMEWLTECPQVEWVLDIPDDQGLQVRLKWLRSGYDFAGDANQIVEYAVYRHFNNDSKSDAQPRLNPQVADESLLVQEHASLMLETGWEFVKTVPVRLEDEYFTTVPTLADSTIVGGQHLTYFLVSGLTATPGIHFDSPGKSGYSVDNLAPGVPMAIMGQYSEDSVILDWDDAQAADFQYYRIYRDTNSGFVPSPENLIQQVPISGWTDNVNDPWQYAYKISAVDFSGNESEAGALIAISDTPGSNAKAAFILHGAAPNPFNPSTTIRYSLAQSGMVSLVVYDLAGHVVRVLVNDAQEEGQHQIQWNGKNRSGGQVSSGVYLYQLRSGDKVEQKQMLLMK